MLDGLLLQLQWLNVKLLLNRFVDFVQHVPSSLVVIHLDECLRVEQIICKLFVECINKAELLLLRVVVAYAVILGNLRRLHLVVDLSHQLSYLLGNLHQPLHGNESLLVLKIAEILHNVSAQLLPLMHQVLELLVNLDLADCLSLLRRRGFLQVFLGTNARGLQNISLSINELLSSLRLHGVHRAIIRVIKLGLALLAWNWIRPVLRLALWLVTLVILLLVLRRAVKYL